MNGTAIGHYHGVSLGLGLQADLPSSQVSVHWAAQGTERKAPRTQECTTLSRDGSLSLADLPVCFGHHSHSLPYILTFVLMAIELIETSSLGNKDEQRT